MATYRSGVEITSSAGHHVLSPQNRAFVTGLFISASFAVCAYGMFWLTKQNSFEHKKTFVTFDEALRLGSDWDTWKAVELDGAKALGAPVEVQEEKMMSYICLLYTSPSPRD